MLKILTSKSSNIYLILNACLLLFWLNNTLNFYGLGVELTIEKVFEVIRVKYIVLSTFLIATLILLNNNN